MTRTLTRETQSTVIRERPVKPATATPRPALERPTIVTRAEVAPCTCPEPCERDHEHD
jgi:hypothetical protein